MCGRYTLAVTDPSALRARFPVGESVAITPRYNVAPGDAVLTVTSDRDGSPRGELLRWGLVPSWAKDPGTGYKMINARVETVSERPAFRRAYERYRCLILADGFYEWAKPPGARKQPFHISRGEGQQPFAFAGLWSVWHDDRDGSVLRTCTILTTAANRTLTPVHDRMPVILPPDGEQAWLDPATPPDALTGLLASLSDGETHLRAVGPAVSDARYDGPACLDPPLLDPEERQPSLFGA